MVIALVGGLDFESWIRQFSNRKYSAVKKIMKNIF